MPAKIKKPVKAAKIVKSAKASKPAKSTKTVKAAKVQKTTKAVLDARESNRLRQQRFLENHRDEINEKRRERYADRKNTGCCPRCGAKLRSSKFTLCKNCLEKAKDYNQR